MTQAQLRTVENLVIGGTAAITGKAFSAPVERVKLLLQAQGELLKNGRLTQPYKGAIDCTLRVFRTEGILPFWRGYLASCSITFPAQALSFALKDATKTLFVRKPTESYAISFAKNVGSGAFAGAVTTSVVYSLDYTRTRLANDIIRDASKAATPRQFNGIIDVYRKTLKSDGFVGLYRGFFISLIGITVYRGCYFGFYDTLRPIVLRKDSGTLAMFALGYGVTIAAGLISYPLDTVRRRMMMRSCEPVKYRGSLDCALQIMRNEGPMAFMRGAAVNIVSGSIVGACTLVLYDRAKALYLRSRAR